MIQLGLLRGRALNSSTLVFVLKIFEMIVLKDNVRPFFIVATCETRSIAKIEYYASVRHLLNQGIVLEIMLG